MTDVNKTYIVYLLIIIMLSYIYRAGVRCSLIIASFGSNWCNARWRFVNRDRWFCESTTGFPISLCEMFYPVSMSLPTDIFMSTLFYWNILTLVFFYRVGPRQSRVNISCGVVNHPSIRVCTR